MFLNNDETLITLGDGSTVLIGSLNLGDVVKGHNSNNSVIGITRRSHGGPVLKINGDLFITDDTLVSTTSGWAALNDGAANLKYPNLSVSRLNVGMFIHTEFDKVVRLDNIDDVDFGDTSEIIELELDGDHTYYTNGYLVHNKGGGSSAPATTTTIQKNEPPAIIQPFLKEIAQGASDAFAKVPKDGFQGDLVADVDPRQREALAAQEGVARGLSGFGDQTQQLADQQINRVLSGDILAPLNERFDPQSAELGGVISAALDPVQQRLQEQILPGISSAAVESGAFGGTRQDVTEGAALRDFSREAGNIASNITFQDHARTEDQRFNDLLSIREFGPELEKINQAALLTAPEIQNQAVQQSLLPGTLLGQTGAAERLFNQDDIDADFQRFRLDTQTPFAGLPEFASIVNGAPFGSTSTLTGPSSLNRGGGGSALSGAIGGGLGGAQLGSLLFPGVGTVAGGLGGAILGGLFG